MRSGGIPYLINRLHGCIDGSIKADGIVRTGNIEINGSGHTDGIDSKGGKLSCTHERAVSADDDHTVDSVLSTDFSTLLLSFRSRELLTTGSVEYGSAAADDVRHGVTVHIYNFFFQKAGITAHNPLYIQAVVNGCSHNAANRCIHPRCISSGCQDSDCFYCRLCHISLSFSLYRVSSVNTIVFLHFSKQRQYITVFL